jgi:hypothetical protein
MNKERPQTTARKEREAVLVQLRGLLEEIPGAETPWHEIESAIYHVPMNALRGLLYRVRIARAQSYDEGVEQGREGSDGLGPRPLLFGAGSRDSRNAARIFAVSRLSRER